MNDVINDPTSTVPLAGGLANAGSVARVGDAVRRPAPPHAASIHQLLEHLAARRFGAPRALGIDDDGFELVSFLPGDVAVSPYPAWANGDSALASVGRLVRRYHDHVADFTMSPEAAWSAELADPDGGPIVCHNDVCLENVVFQHGSALTDPELAATSRGRVDPAARLRLIVDAYGLDDKQRAAVPDVLLQAEEVALRFVRGRVERGDPAFAATWEAAAELRYERKMSWLRRHLPDLAAALR